jgi:hypothetical protein
MTVFISGWMVLPVLDCSELRENKFPGSLVVLKLLLSCFNKLLPGEVGSLMMSWLGD